MRYFFEGELPPKIFQGWRDLGKNFLFKNERVLLSKFRMKKGESNYHFKHGNFPKLLVGIIVNGETNTTITVI